MLDGLDYRTFLEALAPFATQAAFPINASLQKQLSGVVLPTSSTAVKDLRRLIAPATSAGQRRRRALTSELTRAVTLHALEDSTSHIAVLHFREVLELSGLGLPSRAIMDICDSFSRYDSVAREDVVDCNRVCTMIGIR